VERESGSAPDSAVNATIDRPMNQPASGVPIGYGYAPEYGSQYGMMVPRGGVMGGPVAVNDPVKVLDPASLLIALRRRWLLALTLGLLSGAMAAAAVWNLWPPNTGGAQIQLMVRAQGPYVFIQEPSGDFNVFKRTEAMVVKSRRVIDKAIKKPKVAELPLVKRFGDPVKMLEDNIVADFSMGPETLLVTLPAKPEDCEDAKIVLDELITAYQDDRRERSNHALRMRVLQKMYQPLAETIKSNRIMMQALTQVKDKKEQYLIERQHALLLKQLELAEKRFIELQDRRESEEIELKHHSKLLAEHRDVPVTPEEIEKVVSENPAYKELSETVQKKKADIETLAAKISPSAKVAQLKLNEDRRNLNVQIGQLNTLREQLTGAAEHQIRENRYGKLHKHCIELEQSINIHRAFEKVLKDNLERLQNASHLATATSEQAEVLKGQIEADMKVASRLHDQMEALKLELQAPDRVTRFSDPYIYQPTVSRKQTMSTYGAGAGAFAIVLFGIAWWEFRGRRINSVDEVVNNLGLRVVGALPALPDRRGRYMPSRDAFYPNYLIESVDTTRTMLLHAARRESLRAVMVTSANSGEGKTSLSIQLAASLARAGRKTLLIDGDMRNPAAHQVFNLEREPGFSELLRGEVEIPPTIQPTTVRNLWLMPAGRWNPHATEILSQEALAPILERLKGEFDFIIVDSSPVLAAVDSLLIGQQVDAVIFSILHEVSHSPSVYAAHQRLESLGVRILGAVVNGVATSQLGHKTEYVYEDESLSEEEAANQEA
jgi:capsular exopolysaccharide synthesis family protein